MENVALSIYHTNHKSSKVERLVVELNKKKTVSENDFVFFELLTSEKLPPNTFIWLADYRFDLLIEPSVNDKYHYTLYLDKFFQFSDRDKFSATFLVEQNIYRFYKIFINNFGICDIELELLDDVTNRYLKIGSIEISSDKIPEIDPLLAYLFEKSIFYWESISLTKNQGNEIEKKQENILWLLNKIEKIIEEFEHKFIPQLVFDKFYKLDQKLEIKNWTDDVVISEDSFNWIFNNLNSLEAANKYDQGKFMVLNRPYKIKEINSEVLDYNTDVYENQLIHGFVENVNSFLLSCEVTINKRLRTLVKDLDFKSEVYKNYFKRLIYIIHSLKSEIASIKTRLELYIPVKRVVVNPIYTGRFDSKLHYFDIYLHLIAWLEKREIVHFPETLFSGTKDIAKLYEIYSLFKIIDTFIVDLGYHCDEINPSPINKYKTSEDYLNQNQLGVNTVYSFYHKNKFPVSLFYESLPDNLTTVFKTGKRGYRPDFILEINSPDQMSKYYVIFDSKYKKIGSIENHDYEELTFKYIHGIGSKRGGSFNLLGLIIINPIQGSKMVFSQKPPYDHTGNLTAFPLIGRLELGVNQSQVSYLTTIIDYFIQHVQSIFSTLN